jgi:hypothetical protein
MKAAALREWQRLPAHERLRAVSELTLALYRMQEPDRDFSRMARGLDRQQTRFWKASGHCRRRRDDHCGREGPRIVSSTVGQRNIKPHLVHSR